MDRVRVLPFSKIWGSRLGSSCTASVPGVPRSRQWDWLVEVTRGGLAGISRFVAAAIGGSQPSVSAEVEMNVENPLEVLQRRCVYSEIVLE